MPTCDAIDRSPSALRAVLFDLDGTLLDTAPDLAGALNGLRARHRRAPLAYSLIRPVASHGSYALTKLGFDMAEDNPAFEPLRVALLEIYRDQIACATRPFEGVVEMLSALTQHQLQWGIVTNKPGWLTTPLLAQIDLGGIPGCVVSGDTLALRKPDPAPLLYAAATLGVAAAACIYVGDAERDVVAANRAGMRSLVACYGYLSATDHPQDWGAADYLEAPADLVPWLQREGSIPR